MRTVSVEFIEHVFARIIEKLKFELQSDIISLDTDFYLNIPTSEWTSYTHSFYPESLSDDIDNLEKLIQDKNGFCTYVDLDRTASLLRAISFEQNPG